MHLLRLKYFVMQSNSTPSRRALVFVACMTTFVLGIANWQRPFLRLDSHFANGLVLVVVLLLPVAALIAALSPLAGWRQWILCILMLPVIVPSILLAPFVTIDTIGLVGDKRDFGLDPIQRIEVTGGSQVVVYRTDCGAPCHFGIVIRHEGRLVGPLLVVHDLWSAYPADSAQVRLIDPNHVGADDEIVLLRPHVVF
jgi:hypothetical protein